MTGFFCGKEVGLLQAARRQKEQEGGKLRWGRIVGALGLQRGGVKKENTLAGSSIIDIRVENQHKHKSHSTLSPYRDSELVVSST